MHHLQHNISNPRDTVLMVGYQAENTLGRRLVEQANQVRIYGDEYERRCEVATIDAFSGHAGGDELMVNVAGSGAGKVLCVHGERESVDVFEKEITQKIGVVAHVQREGEEWEG